MENLDKQIINKCKSCLANNGLVVLGSDTVLGLMARVSTEAINKVDSFKNRESNKNYSLICNDLHHLKSFIDIEDEKQRILSKNLPGLFTFIVKPRSILCDDLKLIISGDGKLGFRIPTSRLMLEIARRSNFPVLATSANLSGSPSVHTIEELESQFGKKLTEIDIIIPPTRSKQLAASTVVDISDRTPRILRAGSGRLEL